MSRRIGISIFVVALAAAAFGAIAISQAASTSATHSTRTTHAVRLRERRVAHAGASSLDSRFSVLDSARLSASSTGPLPAAYSEHLTEPGTMISELGLEPADARIVDVNGVEVWIIPGQNGLCLGVPAANGRTRSSSCGTLAHAEAEGVALIERPSSGAATVIGLVPNGDTVTATYQDASSSNVAVANNVFVYGGASVQSVSVHAASGSVARTLTLGQ
jgi:hypothetical protein